MATRTDLIQTRSVPWWAIAAMIGSAACWGSATVMSRDLLEVFTPTALLVVQLAASLLALTLIALPEHPTRHFGTDLRRASLAGVFEPGLTYAIGLAGLALTTAGNSSVISATEPLIILVLAWMFLHQRPTPRVTIAVLVAAAGLVLVSGDPTVTWTTPSQVLGDVLVLISTGFAATYVVVTSRFSQRIPPATMATAQQAVGLTLAVALLLCLQLTGIAEQQWHSIDPPTLAYAAASGVVQYALAFWLYLVGLKYLQPAVAGLWLTLTPVFGIAGAFIWLGEIPTPLMVLGTTIVLGALIATRDGR
ncbi:DMT family transporter [Nocardia sp. NPDC050406]|uniref:DMT family transporter n=1 Tax=Nocardia sp. NPDC050406 TaxID=3364318 RepID=UPI0037934362